MGWLWLAVFGIHPKDHVCLDCGYRWSGAFRIWFSLLVLALGAALLTGILFACLPLLLVAAAVLALIGVVVGSFMLFRMLKD